MPQGEPSSPQALSPEACREVSPLAFVQGRLERLDCLRTKFSLFFPMASQRHEAFEQLMASC
jgi:hypothetical protein